jgi:hypothetical protein
MDSLVATEELLTEEEKLCPEENVQWDIGRFCLGKEEKGC